MNISILRDLAARALEAARVPEPLQEARYLAAEYFDCTYAELAGGLRRLRRGEAAKFRDVLLRRLRREPAQYIFGRAYFRDYVLEVTPDVLIPRPETELLVDFLLRETPKNGRLLDLGTGSGAIAVSCAAERSDLRVTAVDISGRALAVARRNAAKYRLTNLEFVEGDCCEALTGRTFDACGANLPYVSETELAAVEPEVRRFEPRLALAAEDNGLALMRRAADELRNVLADGAPVIFEHGDTQSGAMTGMFRAFGYTHVRTLADYAGKTRFAAAVLEKNR